MRNFQLDENFDDRDFAAACVAEGNCIVHGFPPERKGQKDRVILPALLVPGIPLVTLDHRIVQENAQWIRQENGGIIVVKLDRPTRTITTRIAARIIREFKRKFEKWSEIDWSKIYLELTETDTYVAPLCQNPDISAGLSVPNDDPEFETKILSLISRYQLKPELRHARPKLPGATGDDPQR